MLKQDRLLSVATVARELGFHSDTIRRYFDAGYLRGKEVQHPSRRTIRIYQSSVEEFRGEPLGDRNEKTL